MQGRKQPPPPPQRRLSRRIKRYENDENELRQSIAFRQSASRHRNRFNSGSEKSLRRSSQSSVRSSSTKSCICNLICSVLFLSLLAGLGIFLTKNVKNLKRAVQIDFEDQRNEIGESTFVPSLSPSDAATSTNIIDHTPESSASPSENMNDIPSVYPSMMPSFIPSSIPSQSKSETPSQKPSMVPSMISTSSPSMSKSPSTVPSFDPTLYPSISPTISPSYIPSISSNPTESPTEKSCSCSPRTYHFKLDFTKGCVDFNGFGELGIANTDGVHLSTQSQDFGRIGVCYHVVDGNVVPLDNSRTPIAVTKIRFTEFGKNIRTLYPIEWITLDYKTFVNGDEITIEAATAIPPEINPNKIVYGVMGEITAVNAEGEFQLIFRVYYRNTCEILPFYPGDTLGYFVIVSNLSNIQYIFFRHFSMFLLLCYLDHMLRI